MKKIFYLLSFSFILVLGSCTKNDISDETGIEFNSIDKDKVEPPGGKPENTTWEFQEIDKDKVEPPGGGQ